MKENLLLVVSLIAIILVCGCGKKREYRSYYYQDEWTLPEGTRIFDNKEECEQWISDFAAKRNDSNYKYKCEKHCIKGNGCDETL